MAALLAALAGVLPAAGCDATPRTPVPAEPSPDGPGAVACAHVIDRPASPRADLEVVLDAVALPTGVLEPVASGEPGWLFAKRGLLVRAGVAVRVEVAAEAAGRARIGWGSPAEAGPVARVPACGGSGWIAFAGGYTVDAPACVPLTVQARGRTASVRVGVGVACGR
jgi:hypothetical protein